MVRFVCELGRETHTPKVDAFLVEIEAVSRRHGMSIGHEDGHGAFQIHTEVNEDSLRWLMAAHVVGESR